MASEEELADLERLSANYQPERKGPLVGERTPTDALVQEYATADPTYVTKTEALQKTYPSYRPVQGDGNCGWRALPFGLFERILYTNSPTQIIQESSRLESLNGLLTQSGVDQEVYADFVEPTFELLQQLARFVTEGNIEQAEKRLLEAFNDPNVGNAIIMHFRLIASAHLKINADNYAPFLTDAPDIPTYCAVHVDPFAAEIEQMGLQALADAVFEPAGVAFEVLYLDRSEGGEATRHEGGKEGAGGLGKVRLLYRPANSLDRVVRERSRRGHYDLLYEAEDLIPRAEAQV